MKAARRQVLRTNELSQQLDRLGESFKRNSTLLTAIIAAAILIVVGIYWYSNHRANAVSDALARLVYDDTQDDVTSFIERCRAVANEQISPDVNRAAFFAIGATALGEIGSPDVPVDPAKPVPSADDLTQSARDAFTRLLAISDNDASARGAAHFGLAVLDENAGNFAAAREHYNAVKADKALEGTPFIAQADYRLAQVEHWSKPIVFAEPLPLPPAPEPSPEAAPFSPPAGLQPMTNLPSGATPTQVTPAPTPAPAQPEKVEPRPAGPTTPDATTTAPGG
ncbi:MAG TPA: hypothetical protein VNT79_02950 [Phycisphaerae bacterium]|nr:hypothetical protein [Phycisphaerae bacterium]